MALIGQVCSKGVWDSSVPGISFDNDGVSNYAKIQMKLMEMYPRGSKGKADWDKIVDDIKSKGKNNNYDCIIGVSGGVDSSYLLHLAKEYQLRPLAVNLDNGWNSEIAVSNIKRMTQSLNIDLITYVINYEEIKELHRSYIKASLPWIDMPTDLAIKSVMYYYAKKENIKYILRGNDFRSEGKQPIEWTYSDTKQLKYLHKTFGKPIKFNSYPFFSFTKQIIYSLLFSIRDVRPFYYLDYSKQEAKEMLKVKYNWEDYGGHHHENLFTKFTMAYWLHHKFNIDKRKINLSAQIISGQISREKVIQEISRPILPDNEAEILLDYVLKKLDMQPEEFDKYFKAENKYFMNYPSNYKLIFNNIKIFKPLIKKVFLFKPTSIVEKEFRS